VGPRADLEALVKGIISFPCWESNQDFSVSCSFILPGCGIQELCIYSVLDEICATVALNVNRAVSGGQFPSEDIATHSLSHDVTLSCDQPLQRLPTPNLLMADQLQADCLLKLRSNTDTCLHHVRHRSC
jgi:hypothetical protein